MFLEDPRNSSENINILMFICKLLPQRIKMDKNVLIFLAKWEKN